MEQGLPSSLNAHHGPDLARDSPYRCKWDRVLDRGCYCIRSQFQ